ncbi:CIC11C00000000615 [Sungouiella intermedia]|uniref:Vacuolar protein sorting-associated protein 35 n=1 Tax=Sungouiella intermedia TaxID=45354 RepID=A0A1L0DN80_9ASCO|nr:CIC11C00000000615 [[Candida] intermedia]
MPGNSVLQGCLSNIKHQSHLMKESLAEGHLLQALKHCSNFLNELRTSQLTPKEYYELYIAVYDSLESLSAYLLQSYKLKQLKSKDVPFLTDLYELVQYSGNIVPRLYMMIVIGTTYMSTKNAETKEIMKDMIEMCRGVQHPIRGLFLRNYLSQRSKDYFPLATREDFNETVDFLITNFIEMNKLWVRLQHQGHSSERELRTQERKELKILVGSNLVRLSQVIDDYDGGDEYSSEQFYKENIFPTITEQIIQCRDHLAQSYLIDVLVQIFPDNFHFLTLDSLLNDVFLKLHPMLNKSELVETLVNRFVTYHKFEADMDVIEERTHDVEFGEGEEQAKDKLEKSEKSEKAERSPSPVVPIDDIFQSFWNFYLNLQQAQPELPVEEYISILQSLIKLSLTFDPNNYSYLNKIYLFANEKLEEVSKGKSASSDEVVLSLWLDLLITPVRHFSSIKGLLKLPFFYELYSQVGNVAFQKQLSLEIVNKLLESSNTEYDGEKETYETTEDIDVVFKYMLVLINDSDSQLSTSKDLGLTKSIKIENNEKFVSEDFLSVQEKISKVIHLIEHPDLFKNLSNLFYVKKKYLSKCPANTIYTYPTLITKMTAKLRIAGYQVVRKKSRDGDQTDLMITSNFKNISVVIDELYLNHQRFYSEMILRLFLNLATTADQLKQETIAYELFNQCFVVYEENLILNSALNQLVNPHDSMGGAVSYQSIIMISNRLANLRYFNKESYESLITKITLYGSKLLKKQDQCRSVYYCAHLWWWCDLWIGEPSPTVEEESKVESSEGNVEKPVLYRDAKRVLECLQKALRVADSCMDPYLLLKLFVEILNRCLIFSVYGNGLVDLRYINGLIDLIRTNLGNFKDDSTKDEDEQEAKLLGQIEQFFERTLLYVAEQQELEDRFPDIIV